MVLREIRGRGPLIGVGVWHPFETKVGLRWPKDLNPNSLTQSLGLKGATAPKAFGAVARACIAHKSLKICERCRLDAPERQIVDFGPLRTVFDLGWD